MDDPVTHLAWICPSAASLAALARRGVVAAWEEVRADPGAVLLVVRCTPACHTLPSLLPAIGDGLAVLDTASRLLGRSPLEFVDWNQPTTRTVYHAALTAATLARRVAERGNHCDPENAWVAGLLAPLGRLATCARPGRRSVEPETLGRRLARRWHLPGWLTAVAGHLSLPVEVAQTLGADPEIFRVVQLVVALVTERVPEILPATVPASAAALALGLGDDLGTLRGETEELLRQPPTREWVRPDSQPLLRDLLRIAADNRRLRDEALRRRLEDDLDALNRVVESHRDGEDERLRQQKLRSLAEFAAGAGHEINNPLAVISGQAQYLLQRVPATEETTVLPTDPLRKSLTTIVQQAQHVHQLLRGLMQFARPPRPQVQPLDPADVVREVLTSLGDFAKNRSVTLESLAAGPPLSLDADSGQIRTALTCLVRNAIEATPVGGWVRVRLEAVPEVRLDVVIEDSGPGPEVRLREHLFDPVFSGRQAGRGRGLGLPTAWAMARQHCGNVRLASAPGEPTRFVLSLPLGRPADRQGAA
jgi:two-component system, NtrC family, sensor kinase